mmetsp:Transcript_10073/g.18122  ORF Transcript_10073/g.18122 Transcript_10073/m.18122 type:complete len:223 (-) Transcript_10073:142-810(-)
MGFSLAISNQANFSFLASPSAKEAIPSSSMLLSVRCNAFSSQRGLLNIFANAAHPVLPILFPCKSSVRSVELRDGCATISRFKVATSSSNGSPSSIEQLQRAMLSNLWSLQLDSADASKRIPSFPILVSRMLSIVRLQLFSSNGTINRNGAPPKTFGPKLKRHMLLFLLAPLKNTSRFFMPPPPAPHIMSADRLVLLPMISPAIFHPATPRGKMSAMPGRME